VNPVGSHLSLEAGDVHVWWIDLTHMTESDAVLSPEERARAARFQQSHDRRQWIAAHVALRQILAHYTTIAPEALRLQVHAGRQGKPALLDEPSLRFNLTHAGERAALAVAWQREVGIDLEPLAGDLPGHENLDALVASTCTPTEAAWIATLSPPDRREAFLKLWTLKEAYLKGIGVGLTVEPRMIEVGPHPPAPLSSPQWERGGADVETRGISQPIPTSAHPSPSALGEGPGVRARVGRGADDYAAPATFHWTLYLLNPDPAWVAALAVSGPPPTISEHHWPLVSESG
jgi:4'-phosphopantetheinyl transferase